MATIINMPSSALGEATPLQRNASTQSMEIIDVDQIEDPPPTTTNPATTRPAPNQPPRRHVETISLLDSDDDDVVMLPDPGPRSRQRLFSPPPPAPSASSRRIPPVPPIPRTLAMYSSLPSGRRTASVTSPPPIVPNGQPFAFELATGNAAPEAGPSNLHLHPNRHRRIQNELRPEPRSHHTPRMGLGGALISQNRADANTRSQILAQARMQPPGWFAGLSQRVYHLFRGATPAQDGDAAGVHLNHLAADQLFDDEFDHPMRRYVNHELLLRNRHPPPADYKPEYTHPGTPVNGFTFDFAPAETPPDEDKGKGKAPPTVIDLVEDEDSPMAGPSSQPTGPPSPPAKLSTVLVCANCMEPLVLGSGLVGDDAKNRRVWALRCGHMVDGKCLESISVPEDERKSADKQGEEAEGRVDRKGKGKAREVPEHAVGGKNNIRARLRSRGSLSMASMESVDPPPPSPTKTLGKRKRNSTAKNKVQRTHEWRCPVETCLRVHASVLINDVWEQEGPSNPPTKKRKERKMDVKSEAPRGRGAIACFV